MPGETTNNVSNADSQLKEMLGISTSLGDTTVPESTTEESHRNQEGELKKMLGINTRNTTTSGNSKESEHSSRDTFLKNILGVTPSSAPDSVIVAKTNLSDEEKLKSLIGIRSGNSQQQTSLNHVQENYSVPKADPTPSASTHGEVCLKIYFEVFYQNTEV